MLRLHLQLTRRPLWTQAGFDRGQQSGVSIVTRTLTTPKVEPLSKTSNDSNSNSFGHVLARLELIRQNALRRNAQSVRSVKPVKQHVQNNKRPTHSSSRLPEHSQTQTKLSVTQQSKQHKQSNVPHTKPTSTSHLLKTTHTEIKRHVPMPVSSTPNSIPTINTNTINTKQDTIGTTNTPAKVNTPVKKFEYTGSYKDGLPDGVGRQVSVESGTVYEGDFKQGKHHGQGKITLTNGTTMTGEFVLGKMCGKGVRINADGTVQRGIFNGTSMKGEIVYPDGEKFVGLVHNFIPHTGTGTVRTAHSTYVGEVEKMTFHGSGECVYSDGRVYSGEWKNGLMHGQGVLRSSAGSVQGEFREGKVYNGSGAMLVDNKKVWGRWVNGVRHNTSGDNTTASTTVKDVRSAKHAPLKPTTITTSDTTSNITTADAATNTSTNDNVTDNNNTPKVPVITHNNTTTTTITTNTTPTTSTTTKTTIDTTTYDIADGYGTVTLPDNCTITGTFKNNKLTGVTTMVDPIKQITYTGTFCNNILQHGTRVNSRGDKWVGTFLNGFLHGQGEYVDHRGSHYIGMFAHGKFHGNGKTMHNEYVFEGSFATGKKHGYGKLSAEGKFVFEGLWHKDERHGYGVNNNLANNTEYRGQYRHNLYHGEGTMVSPHGRFTGVFRHGQRQGKGVYTGNGVSVSGEWVDNRLHGYATITSATPTPTTSTGTTDRTTDIYSSNNTNNATNTTNTDTTTTPHTVRGLFQRNTLHYEVDEFGQPARHVDALWEQLPFYTLTDIFAPERKFYIGVMLDNVKHGYGQFSFEDGRVYSGEWKNGLMHGQGVLRSSAGSVQGEFREGKMYKVSGTKMDSRGMVYEGSWVNGKQIGPLKVTYPGSAVLSSEDGDDEATVSHETPHTAYIPTIHPTASATASHYEGEKLGDVMHGRGKLTRNGESWEGTFVHGEFTGIGVYRNTNTTTNIHNTQNSIRIGERGTVYIGHFVNFAFHGKGKLHSSGRVYDGTFVENQLHGYGKCIDEFGIYEGEWDKGRKHGSGSWIRQQGGAIEGVWFNNLLQHTSKRPYMHARPAWLDM